MRHWPISSAPWPPPSSASDWSSTRKREPAYQWPTQFDSTRIPLRSVIMRSMPDSDFDDMLGLDVLREFNPISFQRDSQEVSEAESEADCDSVLLECNGELLGVNSVKLWRVRKSACGFETLLFTCPRCGEAHESIRF